MIEFLEKLAITNENSLIDIKIEGFKRVLYIDNKPAYEMGLCCNTCAYYFERLSHSYPIEIDAVKINNILYNGVNIKNISIVVDAFSTLLPTGMYYVGLKSIQPQYVSLFSKDDYFVKESIDFYGLDAFYGVPIYPKTNYYRSKDIMLNETHKLFEFFTPSAPKNWLEDSRINKYIDILNENKYNHPTVVALSVIETRSPAMNNNTAIKKHTYLTHYILDGHHKLMASNLSQKNINILSFIAIDKCQMDKNQVENIGDYF